MDDTLIIIIRVISVCVCVCMCVCVRVCVRERVMWVNDVGESVKKCVVCGGVVWCGVRVYVCLCCVYVVCVVCVLCVRV